MCGLKMKYFVLKPEGEDDYAFASRMAMRAYAANIRRTNSALAKDLNNWIGDIEAEAENLSEEARLMTEPEKE